MPSMSALVFDGPAPDTSRTRVAERPRPAPGAGQVLVAVEYAGINFKDVMMRRGDPGYVESWPANPGLEVSGRVAELGPGVDSLKMGDPVAALTNTGGLAQYAVADAALATRIPDGVAAAEAAILPGVYTTAQLLLHEFGRVRPGDTIVVHSASGAVGTAIAVLAQQLPGIRLIGVVGTPTRLDGAVRAGYDEVFVRDGELARSLRESLGSRGAEIVLDPQGTAMLPTDLEILAPAGRIVLFGNASGARLGTLPAATTFFGRNAAIGGFSLAALSSSAPHLVRLALESILAEVAAGALRPQFQVTNGLENAARLQQAMADGTAGGKHVISMAR